MLGAMFAESSPSPYKEITEKSEEKAPKKLPPHFGEGGEVEFGRGKEVEAEGDEEAGNEAEEFGLRFAKLWPFRLLKTLNLLLLLALLGLCLFNAILLRNTDARLHWSKLWDQWYGAYNRKYYDPFRLVIGLAILLVMATGSRWASRCRLSSPAGLAVVDICFALIFIANLLYIGGFFGLRSFAEYRWYVPRLNKMHGPDDLVELTEWEPPLPYNYSWNYPRPRYNNGTTSTTTTTTPAPPTDSDWRLMKRREDAIRTRLLLDPAIMIVSLLAILVNVGFIVPTWGLIKRSRLCANKNAAIGIGCRRQEENPPEATTTVNGGGESSESEQQQQQQQAVAAAAALAFARFWPIGFVKLLLTSITTALFFISLYGDIGPWLSRPTYHFVYASLGSACLANWILFVQKAWMCDGKEKRRQEKLLEQLNAFRKMDCLFNCVGALAFLSAYIFGNWPLEFKYVYGALIALFLFGPVRNFYLLYKFGSHNSCGKKYFGKDFELNVPLISIQVQINNGAGGNKLEKKKTEEEAVEAEEVVQEAKDGKVGEEEENTAGQ